MNTILQIIGLAAGGTSLDDGQFLVDFDPDFAEGRGLLKSTPKPDEAKRFGSASAAFLFWRTQSTTHPLRPDGKPNRPLTAYTVAFLKVPQ